MKTSPLALLFFLSLSSLAAAAPILTFSPPAHGAGAHSAGDHPALPGWFVDQDLDGRTFVLRANPLECIIQDSFAFDVSIAEIGTAPVSEASSVTSTEESSMQPPEVPMVPEPSTLACFGLFAVLLMFRSKWADWKT